MNCRPNMGPWISRKLTRKEEDWSTNRFNRLRLMIQEAIERMGQKQELPKNWESLHCSTCGNYT